MSSTVTIHYPYHPHVGQTLPVVSRPRHADGAYIVNDPAGSPLQVPVWMTASTAANYRLSETPFVAMAALRDVYALLSLHDWSAPLLSSHPYTGGQHATTQSVSRSPTHPTRAMVSDRQMVALIEGMSHIVKAFFERTRKEASDAESS
jgi:hypothetical protein